MKLLLNARFHFLIIVSITLFLSFNRHSKFGPGDYRNTFYSDRVGYYINLPNTFIYQGNANAFPKGIDSFQGQGYKLNLQTGKVISKYPTGVGMLESPFFLLAHLTALTGLYPTNGFSAIYENAILIATMFWVVIGLWLLFLVLKIYVPIETAIVVIWLLMFATNLVHYATADAGASHAFSFFAVSWLLYLFHFKKESTKWALLVGVSFGLCVSTRYLLAVVTIPFALILLYESKLKTLILKTWLIICSGFIITLIPEILHHIYLGNVSFYEGESFSNLLSPKPGWVLFAPDNGWLLYNPVWLISIPGFIALYKFSINWFYNTLFSFLVLLAMYSCWYDPTMGCGFGHRGFVDIYALLCIPLAMGIQYLKIKLSNRSIYILTSLFIIMIAWNMKLFFGAVTCFSSTNSDIWDWGLFFSFLN